MVTDEINHAMSKLAIRPSDFRLLSENESEALYQELLEHFVEGGDRRWWWESFSKPSESVTFPDNKGFERIIELVPDPAERVWFVVEENQMLFYPIYEATPETIQNVIGECYGFEYYIIPKNRDWLLCENHHSRVIGLGEIINRKLAKYAT